MNRRYVVFGLFLIVVVFLLAFASATEFDSDCFTTKSSVYEGGVSVCWSRPTIEFQRTINAEAYKLGYIVQPDGTFKKVVD